MEKVLELEEKWGKFAGVANVVACASGSAALHLALEALPANIGQKVILPDLCMVACARAIKLAGLEPVFVDCGDDLNMDVGLLSEAFRPGETRAIMAVHTYGKLCNMDGIHAVIGRYPVFVIEDMAETHGLPVHPQTDAACWSFYKNKIIAGAEGGAVAFHKHLSKSASLARQLRSHGFTDKHDFMHVPRGWNYRISDIHAELVLKSLLDYEQNVASRIQTAGTYTAVFPKQWTYSWQCRAPWVYPLWIPRMSNTACPNAVNKIVKQLKDYGIEARHCFKPMSMQPEFLGCLVVGERKAWELCFEVFYLPLGPETWKNCEATAIEVLKVVTSVLRRYPSQAEQAEIGMARLKELGVNDVAIA